MTLIGKQTVKIASLEAEIFRLKPFEEEVIKLREEIQSLKADKEIEEITSSSDEEAQAPSPGNLFARLTPTSPSKSWADEDNDFDPVEVSAPVEDSAPVKVSASSDDGFQVVQSKKVVREEDQVNVAIQLWKEDKPAARSIINDMTEMPRVDHLSDDEWKTFKSIVFWRTTGCSNYHGEGKHCSYGANCLYAHGKNRRNFVPTWWIEEEKDYRYKTKMCRNGVTCFYSGCAYAHSDKELRCQEC